MKFRTLTFILISFALLQGCTKVQDSPKAKYVFYFIGDGMGFQHITIAQAYQAALNDSIGNRNLSFTKFPIAGNVSTYAYNRYITGSAAAGTALSTGHKTSINTVGLNHDHSDTLYSIAYTANKSGFSVGVATSVSIDHATPAGFYAHQKSRDFYHYISHDLINSGYRFFASGGFRDPEGKYADQSLGNIFEIGMQKGYFFTQSLSLNDSILNKYSSIVYSSPNPDKSSSLKYHMDNEDGDVTLAQIAALGIEVLDNPNGFFFMIEGGKIDWASHDNDAASVVNDVIALSDAVAVAVDFYNKHPEETLIIVTADHETGGLSLGNRLHGYDSNLSLLSNQKNSIEIFDQKVKSFKESVGNYPSFNDVLKFLEKELGLGLENTKLSEDQIDRLKYAYKSSVATQTKEQILKNRKEFGGFDPISSASIQILNQMAGIGWTSLSHTGSLVPVFAMGAQQDLFNGQMDNTEIPRKIAQAMGINLEK